MIYEAIAVAVGGALGSLIRFFLVLLQHSLGIYYSIWAVNITGCFLAGLLTAYICESGGTHLIWQRFLMVGFLGGFTSFSSFTVEWWGVGEWTVMSWLYPLMVMLSTMLSFFVGIYFFAFFKS